MPKVDYGEDPDPIEVFGERPGKVPDTDRFGGRESSNAAGGQSVPEASIEQVIAPLEPRIYSSRNQGLRVAVKNFSYVNPMTGCRVGDALAPPQTESSGVFVDIVPSNTLGSSIMQNVYQPDGFCNPTTGEVYFGPTVVIRELPFTFIFYSQKATVRVD